MADFEFLRPLLKKEGENILLLVLDGLGDLEGEEGKTPLEAANTPCLDKLAAQSDLGLLEPVGVGITPGSGPAHLALFGYNPKKYFAGRGVLAALGVGFPLREKDIAVRINFCTLDKQGNIVDRRAGRLPTEECERLVAKLSQIQVDGVELFLRPVREYRAVLILRGENLSKDVLDTDPQVTGVPPLPVRAASKEGEKTASIIREFLQKAEKILSGEPRANGILLRGFDQYYPFPSFSEVYQLKAAAIAVYPMYRGVARLVGMDVLGNPQNWEEEFSLLKRHHKEYDFFFLHIKDTDKYGEDGNFSQKVHVIEQIDAYLSEVLPLFSVIAITGDHSTPVKLKSHSWHPVPLLLKSPYTRPFKNLRFCEKDCQKGSLGKLPSEELLPLLLAHSLRLKKFGA